MHNATVKQQDRRVWRPDFYGSTLFLVASLFAILALGRLLSFRPRSFPWWIAWLNMIGSILFMASAIASYVLPSTGELINNPVSIVGTLLGRRLLPSRSDLDVPGMETCGSSSDETTAPGRSTTLKGEANDRNLRPIPDAMLFGNRFATQEVPSREFPETGMTALDAMRLVV